MIGLELVVALTAAVLLGSVVAAKLGVNAAVVLVPLGLLLSLVPHFRGVGLPPEVVLLLFLPVLLYWESLTTSLREIRRFARGIVLNSTLLVVVTAAAVALVGHLLGLSWHTAWIIGAAVAPTDATAVATLGGSLRRRDSTVLRAESLINDGTALVVFALAVGTVTGAEHLSAVRVTGMFLLSFGGGVVIGLAVGWLMVLLRRQITDPTQGNVATVLTAFVAYLAAEEAHASGVLAVVTCGLLVSQEAPRFVTAHTRQQGAAFWSFATFLISSGLFVLVGVQVPEAVSGLSSVGAGRALAIAAGVYVTILVSRWLFTNTAIFLIRALDRRPKQRELRTTWRGRLISTVAGFRGAVSLAVALAVPETLRGEAFPDRPTIVFVTALVVMTSIIVQSLLLPRVIRWANLPHDTSVTDELHLARRSATEEVLATLEAMGAQEDVSEEVVEDVRAEYQSHLATLRAHVDGEEDHPMLQRSGEYRRLRLAGISRKRATVVRLRDEGVIDDTVLRRVQADLDLEEIRLLGVEVE